MPIESIARPALERDPQVLARKVTARLLESGALAAAAESTETTTVVRMCLKWAIQRLEGLPSPERTDRLATAAAGWARAGVPIATVLHAVHVGFEYGLDLLFGGQGSAERADIVAGAFVSLELLGVITATVSKAYVRECRAAALEDRTAAHTLTSMLLGGHPTSAMARAGGIRLAEHYAVLALAIPPHPDESRPQLDGRVVARRTLRRLQSGLADRFGTAALSLLSVDGGTVLLPADHPAAAELDEVLRALARAARVPLTATVVESPPDLVSAAVHDAHELLDIVEQSGRGPGLHRFPDLALQYQLTRPGVGRELLGTRLRPLLEYPDLLATLRVHIGNDLSRRRTAEQLHIHPNTLDHRLRRVGEITGLDPSDPRQLWYLRSALVICAGGRGQRPA
ncbi:PucR family transcriptional regulator [Nocardia asteroides]|uniref:PucR family transcriptional regulator n=1 Tax=Nocardia asteroides TaxID=1824 RepID=UPI001E46CF19|nr:helix-turn-helix domain-containing protein [Nocardia asteroides]UGT63035.1 helix-turn-helix domain-containing protein [Nocardia asteroides]